MPKKVAETPAAEPIKPEQVIGSGPFVFKRDEWRPGEKVVYVKNTKYKPRAEPPSGLAGGKVAYVDRVEWIMTIVYKTLQGNVRIVDKWP